MGGPSWSLTELGAVGDFLAGAVALLIALTGAITWFATRPRLKVRIVEDDGSDGITFEVENIGRRVTSLQPAVTSTFWYFPEGDPKLGQAVYDVRELARGLPPFDAMRFTAVPRELPDSYLFSWFRTFKLRTTTGAMRRASIVRVDNAP